MAVKIINVIPDSPAERAGISAGDILLSADGNAISDVLDYNFYTTESRLTLTAEREGVCLEFRVKKGEYQDLGLEFESYLMDSGHSCTNKCVFCFVDQMPRGLRDTLYFKDDDSRLSFFFGNYVTLTNMPESEIDRIIKMRISPINISVHSTEPELRKKMMINPRAGETLGYIKKFTDAGIKINAQLVICPGINDGEHLLRSLEDLSRHMPHVLSIACVPVGLTKHREGLFPLQMHTREQALAAVRTVEEFGEKMLAKHGTRLVYAADEYYLAAGLPLPDTDFYEDFAQLENGVGVLALFKEEFYAELERMTQSGETVPAGRYISATGAAAYPTIKALADDFCKTYPQVKITVREIPNKFFGETVTVAGLVTGTDLAATLAGIAPGEKILIPATMLRREGDLFLDGVSARAVAEELRARILPVANDGAKLAEAFAGRHPQDFDDRKE